MIVHACFLRRLDILGKNVGRERDNRYRPAVRSACKRADSLRSSISVQLRHHDIHQDNSKGFGRSVLEYFYNLLTVSSSRNNHALLLQQHRRNLGVQIVILGQQNRHAL